jgi:hypothetical protein
MHFLSVRKESYAFPRLTCSETNIILSESEKEGGINLGFGILD